MNLVDKMDYIHGYSNREDSRLHDQATTLTTLLHYDTIYPSGSIILEAGCGVGAQTVILARNNPEASITSIDVSGKSVEKARLLIEKERLTNVNFHIADIFNLPYEDETFDHVFICFVLEHLKSPLDALLSLKKVFKKRGTITVIEGDHGSSYFYPRSNEAMQTIKCLIDIQELLGGNSLIGREIYPLLNRAGFKNVNVSPRMVYVDSSKPDLVEGFTKNTFAAMVEGVREQALDLKMIDEKTWDKGISDLYRAAGQEGTFCYTFFKGTANK
jgi:ubiquinone/menaquinone biosynthesis C-methylase UbiE